MRGTERGIVTEQDRLEAVSEILDRLEELSHDHILIIEGKKDRRALEALGIRGDMFLVQSSGGPVAAAEYVESHGGKAVILTDWDRRGDSLAEQISGMLGNRPGIDLQIRRELASLCRMYVKDVESMDSLVAFLSGKD